MPIVARWYDDEKTMTYHELIGKLTVEDLYHLTEANNFMLSSVDYTAHMILDWRRCDGVPINVLTHSRNLLAQKYHPNMGSMAHIGMRLEFKVYWTAFERAIRFLIKTPVIFFADTPEQGYQMLNDWLNTEQNKPS
jgi:hypothetical protein